jgi:hypothetical protein
MTPTLKRFQECKQLRPEANFAIASWQTNEATGDMNDEAAGPSDLERAFLQLFVLEHDHNTLTREEFLTGPKRFLHSRGMDRHRRHAIRKVDDELVKQSHGISPDIHP